MARSRGDQAADLVLLAAETLVQTSISPEGDDVAEA